MFRSTKISNLKLKGIPRNNNEDRGPITSSTVFHSLKFKAMQDVHLCMYVCMHVCMYVYVSQGDFRLMSFTAGRCGTPLILNDQLRTNGVRSSNLIVSVRPVHPDRKPIATNPDRRTSEASPPVSDRKAFTNRTALVVQYAFDPENDR